MITKPFMFEGRRRLNQAENGIVNLKEKVDTLITIPNDRLLQVIEPGPPRRRPRTPSQQKRLQQIPRQRFRLRRLLPYLWRRPQGR